MAVEKNTTNNTVSATDFQNAVGRYIEQSARRPVFITKHQHPARVLLDYEEYQRLKAQDRKTPRHYDAADLPEDVIEALEKADYGPEDPAIEAALK